jgi:sugar/nucleoside kinase (ribokinase family)
MLRKQIDLLSIGDLTTDAFIRLKDAAVHCMLNTEDCELCLRFGDKVPFEYVKVVKAVGNAANAAVAGARLGLKTALVANIGDDQNGRECLAELQKNSVVTSFVKTHKDRSTNYHFVLWYGSDRTILVNHIEYDYALPEDFKRNSRGLPPKWIYLTSLASNTFPYHMAIADYLDANPSVKLAFQPGTFQLKLGSEELKRIYARADAFVANVGEAMRILNVDGSSPAGSDVKALMKGIAGLGPKLIVITDNINGAYMFDGERYYHVPMYPDPRPAFDRTGCGDAFASTFVSSLIIGRSPLEALTSAPVNPMSVAQFVGSQEGLLTRDQIEWWLARAPADFKPREI